MSQFNGKKNLSKKISYTLAHRPDLGMILDRIKNKSKRSGTLDLLKEEFPGEDRVGDIFAIDMAFRHKILDGGLFAHAGYLGDLHAGFGAGLAQGVP